MVKNPATPSGVHTPCKEGGKDEWWVTNCDTHNDPFYLCSEKHALLARVGELEGALRGLVYEVLEEYHDWASSAMERAKAALRSATGEGVDSRTTEKRLRDWKE